MGVEINGFLTGIGLRWKQEGWTTGTGGVRKGSLSVNQTEDRWLQHDTFLVPKDED